MQKPSETNSYLIFTLTDRLYGVDAQLVKETVRLPEITPMEDAPVFILGVINLRGRVVPVLDLNSRLGRMPQACYHLSDSVVVLEQSGILLGLLVNDVRDVAPLDEADIDAVPSFEEFEPRRYRFIQCVAKWGEALVMLLAPQHILHVYPLEVADDEENSSAKAEPLVARRKLNLGGGEKEKSIFRARAQRLMLRPDQQFLKTLTSLAIVRLDGEMLGLDLTMVAGFSKALKVTPVPCCPEHIAGTMNLRGDIVTLLDVRPILGLSTVESVEEKANKVVVVQMGHFEVGVLVHEVVDIVHLKQTEWAVAPIAATALRKEHLQGAIPYGEKMLGVLNMQAILTHPDLRINEEV